MDSLFGESPMNNETDLSEFPFENRKKTSKETITVEKRDVTLCLRLELSIRWPLRLCRHFVRQQKPLTMRSSSYFASIETIPVAADLFTNTYSKLRNCPLPLWDTKWEKILIFNDFSLPPVRLLSLQRSVCYSTGCGSLLHWYRSLCKVLFLPVAQ